MNAATIVKMIRQQLGWTQERMGEFLSVGRSQVCNIETGRNDLPADKLLALMREAGWKIIPPETYEVHKVVLTQLGTDNKVIVSVRTPPGTTYKEALALAQQGQGE